MSKNALIIGSGAREHAIAWKLDQSPHVANAYVAPGNGCKFTVQEDDLHIVLQKTANAPTAIDLNDIEHVKEFIKAHNIDLVVIGPEQQICAGWEDELKSLTLVCAPSRMASFLEASKSYAKDFMIDNQLPTAEYSTFTEFNEAKKFIESVTWKGIVIKQDGLCGGKGVHLPKTKQEAIEKLQHVMKTTRDPIVIEEALVGYEISALGFTDGHTVRMMPFSQDHKRVFEGDRGENTGGMGAICPVIVPLEIEEQILEILQKTVDAMSNAGALYKGILYAGLMITSDGPKILEYNCRFGDPETEVILPLLETDLYEICEACCKGTLHEIDVKWSKKSVIGIVMAIQGYPGAFKKKIPIKNIPLDNEHTVIFHAGTQINEDKVLVNTSGRVLCVSSVGKSFYEAKQRAIAAISSIQFDEKHFRRDIGHFVFNLSGVNIDEGNQLVSNIQDYCSSTLTKGTEQIGGFGALVDLEAMGFAHPELVIANKTGNFSGLGYDLVGMCVNDVLCHGAQPVAFLDYYVTGKLDRRHAAEVIKSISQACKESGCALVGGETAEMPGVYRSDQWDVAGCCIGAKEKSWPKLPLVQTVKEGDLLIGIASSGLHSNGFSLVRKIFEQNGVSYEEKCPWNLDTTLGEEILTPTKIYVNPILSLIKEGHLKAVAHITGGGITENLPRVLPDGLVARIDCSNWPIPPIFKWLQKMGSVKVDEMLRTFNCGIGMILIPYPGSEEKVFQQLSSFSLHSFKIGQLTRKFDDRETRVKYENIHELIDYSEDDIADHRRVNVAILISGRGSNMKYLIEKSRYRKSHCNVCVVISNIPDAPGVQLARSLGVDTVAIPHGKDRKEFERKITKELESRDVDLICLAGFMRVLTGEFVNHWRDQIINIHPSILPSFKGAHAVQDALKAKVKVTGCTVHYVAEEVDAGEILAQAVITIEPNDDESSLHAKIQLHEHTIFPEVMENVAKKIILNRNK
uniref:Trifunctional purine biosynthetic protein adenosine-3 n=1 Tax=Acrobeloides nanus TaxID=290746 RepID=A0A914CW69_9BILA